MNILENKVLIPVRVFTPSLVVDGLIRLGLGARTQDELNQAARSFLTLSSPLLVSGDLTLGQGPLSLHKPSILFALELQELGIPPGNMDTEPLIRRFARASVRLRVGEYTLEGYVHVLPGGDALARFNEANHLFVALTSVKVVGPGVDFSTPFLAVNRSHVVAGQEIVRYSALPEEALASASDALA